MDLPYLDRLKNPKWIAKNLKIRKRDGFRCTVCGAKNNLQVHHTFYYKDFRNPWQYPNDSLITLCKKCHKEYHEYNEPTIVESRPFKKPIKIKNKIKPKVKKKKKKRISLGELQSKEPIYKKRRK